MYRLRVIENSGEGKVRLKNTLYPLTMIFESVIRTVTHTHSKKSIHVTNFLRKSRSCIRIWLSIRWSTWLWSFGVKWVKGVCRKEHLSFVTYIANSKSSSNHNALSFGIYTSVFTKLHIYRISLQMNFHMYAFRVSSCMYVCVCIVCP